MYSQKHTPIIEKLDNLSGEVLTLSLPADLAV